MMNRIHRWYCRSGSWRRTVADRLIPWVVDGIDLGPDVLEIGPGPGATTEALLDRVPHLTCVEVDPEAASALAHRLRGREIDVRVGDASALPFESDRFSGAVACTMLHHVPTPEGQDRILAELARVLAPGAWLTGSDSLTSALFRLVHRGDTLVPVDPGTLPSRLVVAGFEAIEVRVARHTFRFRARVPTRPTRARPGHDGGPFAALR